MVTYLSMKPKESKPYSARDTSGKYEHAAPLPQWLKTLEERYQRIHEKILCTPNPKAKYSKDGRLLRPKTRLQLPKSKSSISSNVDLDAKEQVDQTHVRDAADDNNNTIGAADDKYLTGNEKQNIDIPKEEHVEYQKLDESSPFVQSSHHVYKGAPGKGFKNVNSSNSRVSGKTSKSCPAVISNTKPPVHVMLQRSRTTESLNPLTKRHSKVKMSLEAKNILKDMLPDTIQNENVDDASVEQAPHIAISGPNAVFDQTYTDQLNGNECTDRPAGSDKDYLTCSGGSRFPDIQSESTRLKALYQLRQMQCRVPGVGKYDISVGNMNDHFEMTPPGFDVRYTTVSKEPHEELELPAPEIKAQAIAKCTDWLSRCSSTTNLKGDT